MYCLMTSVLQKNITGVLKDGVGDFGKNQMKMQRRDKHCVENARC